MPPWSKFSDDYFDQPAMLKPSRSARLLSVEALLYSNRMLLDGAVPRAALRKITDSPDVNADAAELVAVGLWETSDDGWTIVDFLRDQPSREHVERVRAARAAAGAIGGRNSGASRRSKTEASSKQVLEPRPDPARKPGRAPASGSPHHSPSHDDDRECVHGTPDGASLLATGEPRCAICRSSLTRRSA